MRRFCLIAAVVAAGPAVAATGDSLPEPFFEYSVSAIGVRGSDAAISLKQQSEGQFSDSKAGYTVGASASGANGGMVSAEISGTELYGSAEGELRYAIRLVGGTPGTSMPVRMTAKGWAKATRAPDAFSDSLYAFASAFVALQQPFGTDLLKILVEANTKGKAGGLEESSFNLSQIVSFTVGVTYWVILFATGSTQNADFALGTSASAWADPRFELVAPSPELRLEVSSGISGAVASAVPEPQSWAMLIAGFGLVGLVLRRRFLPA